MGKSISLENILLRMLGKVREESKSVVFIVVFQVLAMISLSMPSNVRQRVLSVANVVSRDMLLKYVSHLSQQLTWCSLLSEMLLRPLMNPSAMSTFSGLVNLMIAKSPKLRISKSRS